MKKIVLLILIFSTLLISEEIKDRNKLFTSICTDDVKLGIYLINGKWEPSGMKPKQHIVQKIKKGNFLESGVCSFSDSDLDYKLEHGDRTYRKGCYNIREVDSEFYGNSSKVCDESWKKIDGQEMLEGIDCKSFKLMPNKYFQQSETNGINNIGVIQDIEEIYKKSIPTLSVGKCKVISQ